QAQSALNESKTALAERTREAAPDERLRDGADEDDAVAAFLADDERIDAIREQARAEARDRAAEWGLDDALDESGDSADRAPPLGPSYDG
ncbi:hypothetical protein EXE43_13970, partial [Halorubrum sp. SS5]